MNDEFQAELKRAVKAANQRLLRLERRNLITPAYAIAINNIQNIIGEAGKSRFSSKKLSFNEAEKVYKYVSQFLNSASSTTSGLKKVTRKRNETFFKRYGTSDKSVNILYKILTGNAYKKLSEQLPSAIVVQEISDALERGKTEKDINKLMRKVLNSENDEDLADEFMDLIGG